MSFEKYVKITDDAKTYIKPQKSATIEFCGNGLEHTDRLFFTGESNISYFWKSEPDYQMLYRRIDDSLSTSQSYKNRFCLDFSGKSVPYPKIAFKKIVTPFMLSYRKLESFDDNWCFGVDVKAKDLKITGFLQITVEVRLTKEGVSKFSTVNDPDYIFKIDIEEGTYDWKTLCKDIVFDSNNTANICYYIEGENFNGQVFFEQPTFCDCHGNNIMPQFEPHCADRPYFNWMGQNLSKIEWQDLKIDINGQCVFDGQVFERCHRFSEKEIPLPDDIIKSGNNTLTFTCTSDYRDAAGYNLKEVGFITNSPSFVISVPENITAGVSFAICVEGKCGDSIDFKSELITLLSNPVLENDGLNPLLLICNTAGSDIVFTLNGETHKILRCVEKADDGVITGTGDMVYIDANDTDHKNYLKWYLSNNIGNMLTIRPTYRWCGTRIPNDALWKKTAEFLCNMGIHYSHMLDGRELPGCNANPTIDALDTPKFLGRQTHEFDGMFCYWKPRDVTGNISEQMFYDLFLRMFKKHSETMNLRYIPQNVHYTDKKQLIFRNPDIEKDMKSAADALVSNIASSRFNTPRHTGPSTLFKYFYQAGYEFLGAELMYTPTEITVAALRGAKKAYGAKKTGAHLAVQWSTAPHDSISRIKRYQLALFTSYILGIDEINTEEGLWRLEEYYSYFNRFSSACYNHLTAQKDFYRFVSTHTRSGEFYTPIAFLSGRYDGWQCFSRKFDTFGAQGFGFEAPEKAWDIIKFYYPKSVLSSLNFYDCPDKPLGYYSGTPYGNVDIVPIEADSFKNYRLLVACGYNKACSDDLHKFFEFVNGGGTLIIGFAQLSATTDRDKVVRCEHDYIIDGEFEFLEDTVEGNPVHICDNIDYDRVFMYTDSKRPLVVQKNIGKGKVYFITAKEYASEPAVSIAYRNVLEKVTTDCLDCENVYAEGDNNVQFSVFDNSDDSKNIYFISTDWYLENSNNNGTIVINKHRYTVPVPFGSIVKVAATNTVAIFPLCDKNEVISLNDTTARVQGEGTAEFVICKNSVQKTVSLDFSKNAVQIINI